MNAALDIRAVRAGHRQPTAPELVRLLQQGSERLAVTVNAWQGRAPSELAITEAINSSIGMTNLLRQLRAMTDAQK